MSGDVGDGIVDSSELRRAASVVYGVSQYDVVTMLFYILCQTIYYQVM